MIGFTVLLVVLSISATFYKTVVLQDFDVTGAYIEFPTEDSSYVWFVYNNEEYELELETSNYEEILIAVADELETSALELDEDFLLYLQSAYNEGEVIHSTEQFLEGNEEEDTSSTIDDELEMELQSPDIADDASSTDDAQIE